MFHLSSIVKNPGDASTSLGVVRLNRSPTSKIIDTVISAVKTDIFQNGQKPALKKVVFIIVANTVAINNQEILIIEINRLFLKDAN